MVPQIGSVFYWESRGWEVGRALLFWNCVLNLQTGEVTPVLLNVPVVMNGILG